MKTVVYILFTFFWSFIVQAQDTIFYWGNNQTVNAEYNRYVVQRQSDKYLCQQSFYKRGGSWFKSDFSDSIIFESNNLMRSFDLYHNTVYDSTIIKLDSLGNSFKILEIYDNGKTKLSGITLTRYPFSFQGKLTKSYRNGQKYADYYYTNNKLDSTNIHPIDSLEMQYYIAQGNDSLSKQTSKIMSQIAKQVNYISPTQSTIRSTLYIAMCIESNKITRTLIFRGTVFELDNESLKAIEKINFDDILNQHTNGCMIAPLRIDLK